MHNTALRSQSTVGLTGHNKSEQSAPLDFEWKNTTSYKLFKEGELTTIIFRNIPANMRHWPNVGLLLGQRRRRWANSNPTLGQRLMFAGIVPNFSSYITTLTYFCINHGDQNKKN